jgi:chromosome segregation ATPase
MSNLINQLASINIQQNLPAAIDVDNIARTFAENFKKLDNFRDFRSNYEQKNFIARWWHNDKLRDAQLDSIEVQAEFSKTVGQLIAISIMQSKELTIQQNTLNSQQAKLKGQADGIADHAGELQQQQKKLADQSEALEKLVREYFELKGLTQDGAKKLIEMAHEIKETKDALIKDFSEHTANITDGFHDAQKKTQAELQELDGKLNENIEKSTEYLRHEFATQQQQLDKRLVEITDHLGQHNHAIGELRANQEQIKNSVREHLVAFSEFKTESVSSIRDLTEHADQRMGDLEDVLTGLSNQQNGVAQRCTELEVGQAASMTRVNELQQQHDDLARVQQSYGGDFLIFRKSSEEKHDLLSSHTSQGMTGLGQQLHILQDGLRSLGDQQISSKDLLVGLRETIGLQHIQIHRIMIITATGFLLTWGAIAYVMVH